MRSIFDYFANLDSEEKFGTIMLWIIAVLIVLGLAIDTDNNQEKNIADQKTTEILNNAHEQAVAAVDTTKINSTVVNEKRSRKDSVRATTKMYDIVNKIHKNRIANKHFFDYVQDSIPIKSEYTKTINTYVDSVSHDTVRVVWSRHKTISGVSPKFNINKAMNDSAFATTYNQYCEAIKQLEIARRQGKLK